MPAVAEGDVIVNIVFADNVLTAAVIAATPGATPVARPLVFTEAMPVSEELHVADDVTSRDVPSEYMPVTVSCLVAAVSMIGLAGDTAMDRSSPLLCVGTSECLHANTLIASTAQAITEARLFFIARSPSGEAVADRPVVPLLKRQSFALQCCPVAIMLCHCLNRVYILG